MILKKKSAFLFLEDGTICQGWSFVNPIMAIGEVVFNTGMTGYQEVITDPSYCQQIIIFTYPEIGNSGINMIDMESSKPHAQAIVAKKISLRPSNWRNEISLVDYLNNNKVPHLFNIDTRFIVKHIRDKGVMLACISSRNFSSFSLIARFKNFKNLQSFHLVHRVATRKLYKWYNKKAPQEMFLNNLKLKQSNDNCLHVVVIDFGVKFNILRRLSVYGCRVTVLPPTVNYNTVICQVPDGIILSNGPGDPALLDFTKSVISKLIKTNIPIFGICLGHQLLSLALGGITSKLKFGHRGLNHPSGLYNYIRMTSQNHGFVVSVNTLSNSLIHIVDWNLNDTTIAGIVHNKKPCFSVQYHPEASPGPHDSDYLFEHFVNILKVWREMK